MSRKKTKKTLSKSKTKTARKAPKETLIVVSKMKDAIRGQGCNVSADVVDALNTEVHRMIEAASKRATDNGRKTVRSYDF